jgi:hypothetical protein
LQAFLDAVAKFATDQQALPLHARDFLKRLAQGAFDRATFIAGNLQSLITKPTEVTRRRRVASLLLAPGIFLFASVATAIGTFRVWKHGEMVFRTENPAQSQMLDAIRLYAQASGKNLASMELIGPDVVKDEPFAHYIRQWVSYKYGDFIRDARFETTARTLTAEERETAKAIVAKYPNVAEEEFKAFDPLVEAGVKEIDIYTRTMVLCMGPTLLGVLLVIQMIINLLSVAAFGTSLGMRLFGLCVIDGSGTLASRGRHFVRNLLANCVLIGALIFLTFSELMANSVILALACTAIASGGAILSGLFFVSALIWPDRSWYDRIAGTHVVLR